MPRNFIYSLAVFLAILIRPTVGQVLLTDSFDDNSLGWEFESRTGNLNLEGGSDVLFGYDYSSVGIPEAPNTPAGDTATSGVRLRTNLFGLPRDSAGIYLDDNQFSGKYQLQVDMWLNWAPDPNLIGTTLHAGPFVGNDTALNPANETFPVQRGAGIIVSSDGDCSNCDYILLKNEAELDLTSGQYAVGDFGFGNQPGIDNTDFDPTDFNGDGFIDSADFTLWRAGLGAEFDNEDYDRWTANYGNNAIDMPTDFPSFPLEDAVGFAQPTEGIVQPEGAAGFRWLTFVIDVDPTASGNGTNGSVGTASFSIVTPERTIQIGTVDNSVDDDPNDEIETGEAPIDLENRISLILIDFFSGGPADLDLGFALYDNLIVTSTDSEALSINVVPEPSTSPSLIFGSFLIAFMLRKRKQPITSETSGQVV